MLVQCVAAVIDATETATNENYLTFRERVEHANEQFSRFGISKTSRVDADKFNRSAAVSKKY